MNNARKGNSVEGNSGAAFRIRPLSVSVRTPYCTVFLGEVAISVLLWPLLCINLCVKLCVPKVEGCTVEAWMAMASLAED